MTSLLRKSLSPTPVAIDVPNLFPPQPADREAEAAAFIAEAEPVADAGLATPSETPLEAATPIANVETAAEPVWIEPEPAVEDLPQQLTAETSVSDSLVTEEPVEQPAATEVRTAGEAVHVAPQPDVQPARTASRLGTSMLRRKAKRDEFGEVLDLPKASTLAPAPALKPEEEAEIVDRARSLIDMMSGSGAGGGQPHERALAADTLLRLLPKLPQSTRVALAQRLAMMEAPPPFLVTRLLLDQDIAVSGPLLEDCMHIADENLFPAIAQGRPEQLRLIARRRHLSRAVTEALVHTDDASVLLTLVRNSAAEIPQEGFSDLAAAAAQNADLLPPLCIRQDLPIHIAFELFWSAPVQLRRYLLTRFLTDSETLTRILRITLHNEESSKLQITVEDLGIALEKALAGDTQEAAAAIAAGVKVAPATIERILGDHQGEAMMALLKVAGVSRADLEGNLPRLTQGNHPLISAGRDMSELQAVFDQLSFTKARILLTYWDWAITLSGPYARHH